MSMYNDIAWGEQGNGLFWGLDQKRNGMELARIMGPELQRT